MDAYIPLIACSYHLTGTLHVLNLTKFIFCMNCDYYFEFFHLVTLYYFLMTHHLLFIFWRRSSQPCQTDKKLPFIINISYCHIKIIDELMVN